MSQPRQTLPAHGVAAATIDSEIGSTDNAFGHAASLDQENPQWWAREAHLAKPPDLARLRAAVAQPIGQPERPFSI